MNMMAIDRFGQPAWDHKYAVAVIMKLRNTYKIHYRNGNKEYGTRSECIEKCVLKYIGK